METAEPCGVGLLAAFRELGRPSLAALARAAGADKAALYRAARLPGAAAGAPWEERRDWAGAERFLRRRLGAGRGAAALRGLVAAALAETRECRRRAGARAWPHLEAAGARGVHPAGVPAVLLRGDPLVYSIECQTATHTVLRPVGADGLPAGDALRCLTNARLNRLAAPPAETTARAVMERYAARAGESPPRGGGGGAGARRYSRRNKAARKCSEKTEGGMRHERVESL